MNRLLSLLGTPGVRVPLFEIEAGDYKYPVGLSYHLGSVKPHAQPGPVGFGRMLTDADTVCFDEHCFFNGRDFSLRMKSPAAARVLQNSESEWIFNLLTIRLLQTTALDSPLRTTTTEQTEIHSNN